MNEEDIVGFVKAGTPVLNNAEHKTETYVNSYSLCVSMRYIAHEKTVSSQNLQKKII